MNYLLLFTSGQQKQVITGSPSFLPSSREGQEVGLALSKTDVVLPIDFLLLAFMVKISLFHDA